MLYFIHLIILNKRIIHQKLNKIKVVKLKVVELEVNKKKEIIVVMILQLKLLKDLLKLLKRLLD